MKSIPYDTTSARVILDFPRPWGTVDEVTLTIFNAETGEQIGLPLDCTVPLASTLDSAAAHGDSEIDVAADASGWTLPTGTLVTIEHSGDGGASRDCTPAAGTYTTLAALITAFQTQINIVYGGLGLNPVTVALVLGKINLSCPDNFGVTWPVDDLRDVFGFTGDLAGTNDYTGTNDAALPPGDAFDPLLGHEIEIASSADGPTEYATVATIDVDPLTNIATLGLRRRLVDGHASATAVAARHCYVDVDTGDEDVFTSMLELSLVWTPEANGAAFTEYARIQKSSILFNGIDAHFKSLHPDVWTMIERTGRWDAIYDSAIQILSNALKAQGRDIENLTDKNVARPAMVELLLWQALRVGGDDTAGRAGDAWENYLRELEVLRTIGVAFDDSQNNLIEPVEKRRSDWSPLGRGF